MNSSIALLLRHAFAAFAGFLAHQGIAADATSSASLVAGFITWLIVCACSLYGKAQINDDRKAMVQTIAGVMASQFVSALAGWLQASSADAADPVALSLLGGNALLSHTRGKVPQINAALKQWTGLLMLAGMSLSLCSCQFLASPAGIALLENVFVTLSEAGLQNAMQKGKISSGDTVTIQRGLAIVSKADDPAAVKVYNLAELGLQTAISKYMLKDGDALTVKPEGVVIQRGSPDTAAKQPVVVTPAAD